MEFTLTLNDFEKHWQKECFYCDDKMLMVGFDRVDSYKGYTQNNIVPCCGDCNIMKRTSKQIDFINRCIKIVKNLV